VTNYPVGKHSLHLYCTQAVPSSLDKYSLWQEDKLQHLRAYVKKHGHAYVTRHHTLKNDFKIGPWVANQRNRFKHGVLSKERQDALESIPEWTWTGKHGNIGGVSRGWLESYGRLKEYVEREGHANVPSRHKTKDGYSLGAWVNRQRHQGDTKLTKEQTDLLEQLPGWSWAGNRKSAWDEAYEQLKEYCECTSASALSI